MNNDEESSPHKSNQIEKDLYKDFKFYLCPEATCEFRNNSKESFVKHVIESHPTAREKIFKLTEEELKTSEKFQCDICEDKFSTRFLIQKHILFDHKLQQNVNVHIIEILDAKELKPKSDYIELLSGQSFDEYSFYVCPECVDLFCDKLSLVEHAFGYHVEADELHKKFINIFRAKYVFHPVEKLESDIQPSKKFQNKIAFTDKAKTMNKDNSNDNHLFIKGLDGRIGIPNKNDFVFDSDKIKTEFNEIKNENLDDGIAKPNEDSEMQDSAKKVSIMQDSNCEKIVNGLNLNAVINQKSNSTSAKNQPIKSYSNTLPNSQTTKKAAIPNVNKIALNNNDYKCKSCNMSFSKFFGLTMHKSKAHKVVVKKQSNEEDSELENTAKPDDITSHNENKSSNNSDNIIEDVTVNSALSKIKPGENQSQDTKYQISTSDTTILPKFQGTKKAGILDANKFAPKNFKCDICGLSYTRAANLKGHKFSKHGKDVSNTTAIMSSKTFFKCDSCGVQFAEKCNLEIHMKCHIQPKTNIDLQRKTEILGEKKNELKPRECCGKTFSTMGIKSHKQRHLKNVQEKELITKNSKIQRAQFTCNFCERKFNCLITLDGHKNMVHYDDNNFVENDEKISKKSDKSEIKSETQQEKSTFPCVLCGKVYLKNGNLLQHQRAIHGNMTNLVKTLSEKSKISEFRQIRKYYHVKLHI